MSMMILARQYIAELAWALAKRGGEASVLFGQHHRGCCLAQTHPEVGRGLK